MPRKWASRVVWGLLLLVATGGSVQAEWSFYNPFASQPAKKKPSQPSFFSKTADFLNPFNDADDKPKKKESGSFWGSWFGPSEPEPLPPATVGEFMGLPRP
ncbi:hypothetical protein [Blastopirellula retiformator]|uniref:Uncharacterized protein n=1 Tax=Blastopirellula retiformator TaxID=2527970 RepID=A0A5C5V0G4_9BACT|nr:hypothetical protein [Blastopirellula retiformator]TWT31549.1 hypothetical protein Enr8_34710 [Blastopirellula retiformator]